MRSLPYTTLDIKGLRAIKRHLLDKDIQFLKDYINSLIAQDIEATASVQVKREYREESNAEEEE